MKTADATERAIKVVDALEHRQIITIRLPEKYCAAVRASFSQAQTLLHAWILVYTVFKCLPATEIVISEGGPDIIIEAV